ncbi:MFS transporter [Saccharopolyspora erythraea]|uniref:Major facilitator superfamily (MFS) profile domain-containing protein n=2 Tax=Saccharopolyspora erythraea TaxID=1836 RepID=A0ABP3PGX3_SACER|nr:MFS transporter [Saccharopolyspora erythraea]CAM04122.1 probable multidrug ABC transporter, permease [Saccharopolyspora erythraea NRRL 2338]
MSTADDVRAADRIAADEAARTALQRRVLVVVVAGQVLGGAGLAAGITVGALLAQEMLGSDDLSGLPTALFTLGSALAAFLVGRITQRHGRRLGIGLGFTAGGIGALGVVVAAVTGNVVLLLVALFVYGAGTATNLQARYAGADLARPVARGTAISLAMVATTLGAVAGPNLVEPLGALAIGVPALAGPFLLAAVATSARVRCCSRCCARTRSWWRATSNGRPRRRPPHRRWLPRPGPGWSSAPR